MASLQIACKALPTSEILQPSSGCRELCSSPCAPTPNAGTVCAVLQLDTRVHHLSTPSNWSIASASGQTSFYSVISAAIQLLCPCPILSLCMKTKTEALILGAIHRLFLPYPHYMVIISYFVFLPKKFWDVSHFSLQRLLWFCQIILSLHFLHPFKQ